MAKPTGFSRIVLAILKYAWIPVLLIVAFIAGAYLGYEFMAGSSGSDIFSIEAWKTFIEQIKSLR